MQNLSVEQRHTFLVEVSTDDDCVFAVQEEVGAIWLSQWLVDLSGVVARSQRMKLHNNIISEHTDITTYNNQQ